MGDRDSQYIKEQPSCRVVVVGSFIMDLIVRTPRFPKEAETIIGTEFGQAPGGKGANQAVAAARLGGRVTMVGRVGNDAFGAEQISSLSQSGVDTRFVIKDSEAPTGIGSITLDARGNNSIVIVPGANMRSGPADVEAASEALAEADVIVLQMEIPEEVNAYVLKKAADMGKPVILNPAPARPLDEASLAMVTVLTPNETEAELLTGVTVETEEDALKAAKILLDRGVQHVVLTLGEKGALLVNHSEVVRVPARAVDVVDTTAAGDAFNGALAVSLALKRPWKEALEFANAVGALTVTKFGAQPSLPTLDEVRRFMNAQVGGSA